MVVVVVVGSTVVVVVVVGSTVVVVVVVGSTVVVVVVVVVKQSFGTCDQRPRLSQYVSKSILSGYPGIVSQGTTNG